MERILDTSINVVVFFAIGYLFIIERRQALSIKTLNEWANNIDKKLDTINYNQTKQVLRFLETKKELTEEDKFLIGECQKFISKYEIMYKTPQN